MTKLKIGDIVALRKTSAKHHNCPKGRDDNKTATIRAMNLYNSDGVMLDIDLHGCKFWNIKDLKRG